MNTLIIIFVPYLLCIFYSANAIQKILKRCGVASRRGPTLYTTPEITRFVKVGLSGLNGFKDLDFQFVAIKKNCHSRVIDAQVTIIISIYCSFNLLKRSTDKSLITIKIQVR